MEIPTPPAPRRAFLRGSELPGLLLGVLRGRASAMRRIVGARYGGRIGLALAAVGLLAACPPSRLALVGAGALALGAIASSIGRSAHGLSAREYLRLLLWLLGPFWLLAAPLRLGNPRSAGPALGAAVLANLLLWLRARRGLERLDGWTPHK